MLDVIETFIKCQDALVYGQLKFVYNCRTSYTFFSNVIDPFGELVFNIRNIIIIIFSKKKSRSRKSYGCKRKGVENTI